jgi:glyoxylase-like metal-dependent hydrolase (beta-lactamase superfamily II)
MTQENHETNHSNHVSDFVSKVAGVLTLEDGASLPGGSTRIVDAYSSFYPVPIGDSGKIVLIDGGLDKHGKKLEQFIEERSLSLTAIQAVILTHVHADHIGAIEALLNNDTKTKVFVSSADNEVLQGHRRSEGKLQKITDRIPALSPTISGVETEILEDGDVISFGDQLKVQALAIPGHTIGSMGFKVSSAIDGSRVLYVGDALDFTLNGPKNSPWLLSGDTKTSKQSVIELIQRITHEGMAIDSVVPAHSGNSGFNILRRYMIAQKLQKRVVSFSVNRLGA